MNLYEIPISHLPKTSGRTIKLLENLGIRTFLDLLHHFPFRYEDYSQIVPIKDALNHMYSEQDDEQTIISKGKISIRGTITRFDNVKTQRGFQLQKIAVEDETGKIDITLFNQSYLRSVLKPGCHISLSGHVKEFKGARTFQPEEYHILPSLLDTSIHTERLVPMYQQTRGLSSKTIREKIWYILTTHVDDIMPSLPADMLTTFDLVPDKEAYLNVHFPQNHNSLHQSRHRMAFDELFIVQLSSQRVRQDWKNEKAGHIIDTNSHEPSHDEWIQTLPFTLTAAQSRVINEVYADLSGSSPMNRLIQGDVGSGKTVVAAACAYMTHLNQLKTLCMAPTEILAQQHYVSFQKLFSHLPAEHKPSILLVTGSQKPSAHDYHEASIIIGTHALISRTRQFDSVGLVIVDEQHKFGVVQRAKLKEKGTHPHLLSMTATPIPRTIMLTLYGELDISRIDELPPGRKPVKTYVVPPHKRFDAYTWIAREIAASEAQVFVVCPLIDESESLQSVKSAKVEYENLQKHFPQARIGLLHGRQKATEKDAVLADFANKKLDILVSTPVVEVGIDIPSATIIIIETAERFGLAQLHQLRGRVGRSEEQSHCLLFTEHTDPLVHKRLETFAKTHDGFKLAEYDLHRRGGGNMYGTQQHGSSVLHIASLMDAELIKQTSHAVKMFIDEDHSPEKYPELSRRLQRYQTEHIARD